MQQMERKVVYQAQERVFLKDAEPHCGREYGLSKGIFFIFFVQKIGLVIEFDDQPFALE